MRPLPGAPPVRGSGKDQDMTISAKTRAIIREAAEARDCKYRITKDEEVHFYGRMPNSIETGWWLFGLSIEDAIERIGN